ncbi:hypothetical protein BHAOGJBA_2924 [Methylobacterium hispanicum]|uniref:Uncharacterized protein n=1 Tax=Methylobacterium hispanicum TaxID=270350 RepID=A0AAV4ZMI8_9HYPH|nr:hypothetical protein BHAOGJBA_2924 [Methylobacterium hispanicum]
MVRFGRHEVDAKSQIGPVTQLDDPEQSGMNDEPIVNEA